MCGEEVSRHREIRYWIMMSPEKQGIHEHQTWIGYLQPEGLVVSAAALVQSGLYVDQNIRPVHLRYLEYLKTEQATDEDDAPILSDLTALFTNFLDWPENKIVANDELPECLKVYLPEYQETLEPTLAIKAPEPAAEDEPEHKSYQLLVHELPAGLDFDKPDPDRDKGWQVSPAHRFERMLRESGVPVGLLVSPSHLRLVYAPGDENAGHITFPVASMAEVSGRPMLGGLHLLLESFRLFAAPDGETLTDILAKSRKFQANVSTALANQVLDSLYELLRGLQAADTTSRGELLREVIAERPDAIYEAMLNTLMRLVFLLFVEDRGLMPASDLYQQNYAVQSLHQSLRIDAEHYPDTMDQRYGAWARLLAVFRLVYTGSRHDTLRMPARHGYLFDPDRFPFLEGRKPSQKSVAEEGLPRLPDGTIHRVLENLLYLDGERLSYRTLDVEQIGSVYETMMGFRLHIATGPTIALKPVKKHGAAANIDLDQVLATAAKDRAKFIKEHTDRKVTGNALKDLKASETHEDLLAALERHIARNATPRIAAKGSLLLQPSDARRKSGSHYTPRSLTHPIVQKTLEPILARLADETPGQDGKSAADTPPMPRQILDLKVCDPAVGSGAFLVEACRQLGDALVKAWAAHGGRPHIPEGESERFEKKSVVPIRFVRACTAGHVDDIDWNAFVHQEESVCPAPKWIEERGTTGRLADTYVICGCGAQRSMAQATMGKKNERPPLGFCSARRPWLGANSRDGKCDQKSRLLIRSASNAYFPQMLSAISIPSDLGELVQIVESLWDAGLRMVAEDGIPLKTVKKTIAIAEGLKDFSEAEVMAAIEAFQSSAPSGGLKSDEFSALTRDADVIGKDEHGSQFHAVRHPKKEWRDGKPWMVGIEDVRLVHRLREVVALMGFTRFESPVRDASGDLDVDVEIAPLSLAETWLPATENWGEGIFLKFDDAKIAEWLNLPAVGERSQLLLDGFASKYDTDDYPFFGSAFYMVHTFSHLLMTQISLECGYPASSLRERIYAEQNSYGVMIFTGSSDAEGTLGGLIGAGNRIADIIRRALISAELCSNDPVCSAAKPNPDIQRELIGSACHGCLLVAETSCERQNWFLDRPLVVKTLENPDCAFFSGYSL